jgi:predicted DNA-binding transcriptional regulator AlpA
MSRGSRVPMGAPRRMLVSKKRNTTTKPEPHEHVRFISIKEAAALVGRRRETLWRWTRAGHFPAARLLGPTTGGARGYLLADVLRWIRERPPVTTQEEERTA